MASNATPATRVARGLATPSGLAGWQHGKEIAMSHQLPALHTHATQEDWAWCTTGGCVPPAPNPRQLPNLGGMYDLEAGFRQRRHAHKSGW